MLISNNFHDVVGRDGRGLVPACQQRHAGTVRHREVEAHEGRVHLQEQQVPGLVGSEVSTQDLPELDLFVEGHFRRAQEADAFTWGGDDWKGKSVLRVVI